MKERLDCAEQAAASSGSESKSDSDRTESQMEWIVASFRSATALAILSLLLEFKGLRRVELS